MVEDIRSSNLVDENADSTAELRELVITEETFPSERTESLLEAGSYEAETILDALLLRYFRRDRYRMYSDYGFRGRPHKGMAEEDPDGWVRVFESVCSRLDKPINRMIEVPMQTRDLAAIQDQSVVQSWAKSDRAIYEILVSHGAELVAGTPTAVFMCCPKDVAEFVFEMNGWDEKDIELDEWRVNTALRYLRNPDAFRWINENCPELIDWKEYSVPKMFDRGPDLLLPIIETMPDRSVKSKKIYENLPAFCAGFWNMEPEQVLLLARKLKLNADELGKLAKSLDNHPGCNTQAAEAVKEYISSELSALGTSKSSAKKKTGKAGVAQLTAIAIEAMRRGDSSGLDALKPVAGKVNPVDAVRLLKYGAIKGDAGVVEKLYEIFGTFELPSIALYYAIAFGNDGVARALIGRGVSLGMQMAPVSVKGDTFAKQGNRMRRYFGEVLYEDALEIPGRMGITRDVGPGYIYLCTLSSKSDDLIKAYAEEGLLENKDLKGLMLACLAESDSYYMCGKPRPKLAKELGAAGGLNDEELDIHVQRGPQMHHADIREVEDLLYPGCSPVVARAVCSLIPESISMIWDERYLKQDPEVVRILVPYLDSTTFKNAGALLNVLAKNGFDDEIQRVCKWEDIFTEKMLQKAIDTASETGKTATVALLIDLKGHMFSEVSTRSLEL